MTTEARNDTGTSILFNNRIVHPGDTALVEAGQEEAAKAAGLTVVPDVSPVATDAKPYSVHKDEETGQFVARIRDNTKQ